MLEYKELVLSPKEVSNSMIVRSKVSDALNVDINRIKQIDLIKKSIDARQKNIKVLLNVRVHIDEITPKEELYPFLNVKYQEVSERSPQVIIVGAGPAGLFAGLKLLEHGIKPIILERGKDVDSRRKDLALISREGKIDPNSNFCFGEGGAGTFSDGKLYTRSKKKGPIEKILGILHTHGAKENILYEAHPHIGTDCLPDIIKRIRYTILNHGGEIHFNSLVTDLLITDPAEDEKKSTLSKREIIGVITSNNEVYYGPVILATGHSSRDTMFLLKSKNIKIEPKGIAVGVRLEHPQTLIDSIQYHDINGRGKYLPPAEYSLLTRIEDRGVYSFCMCPGGIVVPSASGPSQSVVNGMSSSSRGSKWANSAIVVEINESDIPGTDSLKMLAFQENIEKDFFKAANGTQQAPAQRMTDFVNGLSSSSLNESSYQGGLISSRVDLLLPSSISERLKKAFVEFGKKKKGFLTSKATVIGAETRTSSPIRIPRDIDTYEHIDVSGLYPAGEGAGWAGGIVSSALDGQNAAEALSRKLIAHDAENV